MAIIMAPSIVGKPGTAILSSANTRPYFVFLSYPPLILTSQSISNLFFAFWDSNSFFPHFLFFSFHLIIKLLVIFLSIFHFPILLYSPLRCSCLFGDLFLFSVSWLLPFFFYNSLEGSLDPMEIKKEFIARLHNKDKHSVRITDSGIFEYKDGDVKHSRRVCNFARPLTVKLVKTQILANNKFRFAVRVSEEGNMVELVIEGKEELERLYRALGGRSVIVGLQEVIASFKKVGEGSFAQVYEAVTNYQLRFALKSFQKKALQASQKTKKAYLNQIDIMKRLSSPHIVAFEYIFETEKAFYLKMEYFQKTLKDRIASKMLVRTQKRYMKQLLLALAEMRSKGVIHRDLKPDNIMLRKTGKGEDECVIIDFGLATLTDALPYLYFRCGTPGFLSPQIANLTSKKERQACSSDMFSLGCIFYKMLTGHYLFAGKTAKEVLQHNRKCEYSASFEGLSVKQKKLLLRMIDPNPASRITPDQALLDPYFDEDVDDSDEIPDEECAVDKKVKRICHSRQIKNMESVYSSMESFNEQLSSSRVYNPSRRHGLKDSCLTFDLPLNDRSSQDQIVRKSSRSAKARQSRFSRVNNVI